ncbi:MAG: YdeI/OmpD-associated family protein [Saprospiraceae bacterium]
MAFEEKEIKDGVQSITASSSEVWRSWLELNHDKAKSVWLIIFKKDSGVASLDYEEAVEESLCFGWIDSKPNKRDEKSYYQFFAKRKEKSNWSRKNKETIQRLIDQGKMHSSGLEMVKRAKEIGTWDALNDVENLIVPKDLQAELDKYKNAIENWNNFPPSTRRGILEWILNAKKPETREKRILETAEKAERNIRANQFIR